MDYILQFLDLLFINRMTMSFCLTESKVQDETKDMHAQ